MQSLTANTLDAEPLQLTNSAQVRATAEAGVLCRPSSRQCTEAQYMLAIRINHPNPPSVVRLVHISVRLHAALECIYSAHRRLVGRDASAASIGDYDGLIPILHLVVYLYPLYSQHNFFSVSSLLQPHSHLRQARVTQLLSQGVANQRHPNLLQLHSQVKACKGCLRHLQPLHTHPHKPKQQHAPMYVRKHTYVHRPLASCSRRCHDTKTATPSNASPKNISQSTSSTSTECSRTVQSNNNSTTS